MRPLRARLQTTNTTTMYEFDSYKTKDGIVKIFYDEDAESPREWINMWHFVSNCPRSLSLNEGKLSLDELCENHKQLERDYIIVPVYGINHSGWSFSLAPMTEYGYYWRFDGGMAFIAYVAKKDICAEYGTKICTAAVKKLAMQVLAGEVETFNDYVQGRCYGYVKYDNDGNEIDSCWGFIGDSGLEDIREYAGEEYKESEAIETSAVAAA